MAIPTETEFRQHREAIRRAHPTLFDAVEEQLRYVDQILPSTLTEYRNAYDVAISAHLARASSAALGIIILCENGFGELALAALRPLGETMVSAYFMSLEPEVRAAQFSEFEKFEAIETYQLFKEMGWDVSDVMPKFRDEAWVQSVRDRFPKPALGWMQLGMDKVIASIESCWKTEQGKKQLFQVARLMKLVGDRQSHVGAIDTASRLSTGDEYQLTLHMGPQRKWVPMALVLSAWVYGQIFDLWADHFRLPDLESWRRRWNVLIARCARLDKKKVAGVGRNDPCPCGSGFKFKRCHLDVVSEA